mmetsp:Transcript_4964/g.7292  ORF Transcript_4964/g.7292 Transcript_4964/m.7292 type:complete len:393 (+) Transcript_4964:73-1251(+)
MHRRRPAQNEAAARAAGQLTEHLSKLKPEDLPPVHVVAYKGATKFVKAYPVTSVLYILGLGLMCFASGLMPSEEAADEYSRLLQEADYETSILETAELKVAKQNGRYQNTRGFMGFSCDTACNREYQTLQRYQQEHKEAKAAQFKALSQAKGKVGVFSMFAVQEARDLFWGSMGQGKAFAKRASMWDLLFMGLGSIGRDEGMVAFAFRLALNVLMNFTMGLIGATVAFIWFLWDVIRAYQPDPVTAVLAFSLFTIAAISMVATYLMTLYGAVGASAYMIVRQCALSIDNGQGGAERRGPAGHIGHDEDESSQEQAGDAAGNSDSAREEHASWAASGLRRGQRVRVRGLASRPEFNGTLGLIRGQEEDRWLVQLDGGDKVLKLKEANLDAHVD